MIDINLLKPLLPFNWQDAHHRAIDKQYFAYYGIEFADQFGNQLQHCLGHLPLAGYDIAVQYFTLPSNTDTVVLIHGYFDHVGLFGPLIQMLIESGYNILAYDLPGHGLSSGEPAGIPDFSDYQDVLTELLCIAKPHLKGALYFVGQSTGGAIAMDYVLHNAGHGARKIVLLAPLVIPAHWTYLRCILFTIGIFKKALPRSFHKNTTNVEFMDFVKYRDPLQSPTVKRSWAMALLRWQKHFLASPCSAIPAMVIQGENDTTVDWRYDLEQIPKKFSALTVIRLPGAMHHLANESAHFRTQIFADIKAFLKDA